MSSKSGGQSVVNSVICFFVVVIDVFVFHVYQFLFFHRRYWVTCFASQSMQLIHDIKTLPCDLVVWKVMRCVISVGISHLCLSFYHTYVASADIILLIGILPMEVSLLCFDSALMCRLFDWSYKCLKMWKEPGPSICMWMYIIVKMIINTFYWDTYKWSKLFLKSSPFLISATN